MKPTIFALATAQGRAGVAIIRISGAETSQLLKAFGIIKPLPRQAVLTNIIIQNEIIDQALVLWFPAPHSYTGEDCAELHVHGSIAIIDKIYNELHTLGACLAAPGEFTRRAFEQGKIDLTQAEAIADLVDAEDESQRRQALGQLKGDMAQLYAGWQDRLVSLLAQIEALIDFPEDDLPATVEDRVHQGLKQLGTDLALALKHSDIGQQIRDGYRIVILGKPNAGKSSLFNALLQQDRAIVTPKAGTTRDVLEARLNLGGHSVWLYDTAGLRDSDDDIEREGIRRARANGEAADLRLWVVDATDNESISIDDQDWLILNKSDLGDRLVMHPNHFKLSLKTNIGLEAFKVALSQKIQSTLDVSGFPAATRQRHKDRLQEAVSQLHQAQAHFPGTPELCAEDLRKALRAFEALFGRFDVERVLDHIFSSFCIGK